MTDEGEGAQNVEPTGDQTPTPADDIGAPSAFGSVQGDLEISQSPFNWPWTGAKWWKTDFHAHSMASFDYGNGAPNEADLKARTYEQWLLDFMAAGLDCVVVTDHNSGRAIDAARTALANLERDLPDGFRRLTLIPGVELTVYGGTHVTAILPMAATSEDVDRLLGAIGYEDAAGSSSAVSRESLSNVIGAVTAAGGYVIASHADARAGIFDLTVATLTQVLSSPGLLAIELENGAAQMPTGLPVGLLPRARVCGSDSHHPTGTPGQAFPGSRFTWVKMDTPTTEGIRLALLDGDLSLLRGDTTSTDPNLVAPLAVRSLEILNSAHIGRPDPMRFTFSPWLNAIIGGRGTGKSTLVELMRLALDRANELPDAFAGEFAKYATVGRTGGEFGLLRDDTVVRVEYVKDGTTFRVTWRPGGEREIEQFDAEGWTQAPGDVAARFPIRIYSQKQIFHLAGDSRALLEIVDEAPPVNRRQWQEHYDAASTRFLAVRARAREIESGLTREGRIGGELDDIRHRIELFETSGYAEILRDHRTRLQQRQAIEAWEFEWDRDAVQVREAAEALAPTELPSTVFDPTSDEFAELRAASTRAREAALAIRQQLLEGATALSAALGEWKAAVEGSAWARSAQAAQTAHAALVERLAGEGIESTREHGELLARQRALEADLTELEAQKAEAATLRTQANDLLENIKEQRRALTQLRRDFLADVLRDNQFVRVRIVPYGAIQSVEAEFRQAIGREDMHFGRFIGRPGADGLLRELGTNLARPERTEAAVSNLKAVVRTIATGQADRAIYTDTRFTRHFEDMPPERLDRLDLWFPEDSLSVTYSSDGTGRNFVAIGQASPGQKTATLLAFLLSYGTEPLVLDQPEDDLDNHLIYELIVTQLRETKRRRQVIVVTHNPNIVVNGDAEAVVALRSNGDATALEGLGSLQDGAMRDLICRVMEGGYEAFEERYRRIVLRT